jgi:hypothetical protein
MAYPVGKWIKVEDTPPPKDCYGLVLIFSDAPASKSIGNTRIYANDLPRRYRVDIHSGARVCDYWMLIPEVSDE